MVAATDMSYRVANERMEGAKEAETVALCSSLEGEDAGIMDEMITSDGTKAPCETQWSKREAT